MTEPSAQDPLYEYKQQRKEQYRERRFVNEGSHHVLQDDVYTTLDPSDSHNSNFCTANSLGNTYSGASQSGNFFSNSFTFVKKQLYKFWDFMVPRYSALSVSEATSTWFFFGTVLFVFLFLFLSLF